MPKCKAPKTPGEYRNYLINRLKEHHPKNWTRILDITKSIGIPLPNWRDSHRICVKGENIIISRNRILCFDTKDISNITRKLYTIYTESYQTDHTPNLRVLDNLSQQINKFKLIDYYIFLKCLMLVPDHIHAEGLTHFMRILTRVMNSRFSNHKTFIILHKFASVLFRNRKDLMIIQPSYMLAIWHPFSSNISGYAMYGVPHDPIFEIKPIYKNETAENLNKVGLIIAGIIPDNFLKKLTRNVSKKEKNQLVVQMLMVASNPKFSDFFQLERKSDDLIGVSIPTYWKNDKLPILQAYFYKKSSWKFFGTKYIDPSDYELFDLNLLDRLTYFTPSDFDEAEPTKTPLQQDCSQFTLNINSSAIKFKRYKNDLILHPENLCLTINLQIPALICHEGVVFVNGDFDVACFEHPKSNITADIYGKLFEIYSHKPTNLSLIDNLLNNANSTYSDVKIHFLFMKAIKIQNFYSYETPKSIGDLLERGITLIYEQAQPNQKINYIANFLNSFLISLPENFDHHTISRSNFIYTSIHPTSINSTYGVVLYKETNSTSFTTYQIKPLTLANLTVDYTCDKNVEAIFIMLYPSEIKTAIEENIVFNLLIVDNDPTISDSKILAVHHISYAYEDRWFEFGIYLRPKDGSHSHNNWHVINSQSEVVSLAYIKINSNSTDASSSGKRRIQMVRHIQSSF